jgi:hypothetical protein
MDSVVVDNHDSGIRQRDGPGVPQKRLKGHHVTTSANQERLVLLFLRQAPLSTYSSTPLNIVIVHSHPLPASLGAGSAPPAKLIIRLELSDRTYSASKIKSRAELMFTNRLRDTGLIS